MKEIKGHSYAYQGVLTVTYADDTTDKFFVTDEQHMAFIRSGKFDDKGQPIPPTAAEQDAHLTKLRAG